MPSAPQLPTARPSAQRQAARREYESLDSYSSETTTMAAGTAFQRIATFNGRADRIRILVNAGVIHVRFGDRGRAAGAPINPIQSGLTLYDFGAEIVEARDPTGAGGMIVTVTGLYASRDIDVRDNRPGPSRERPFLPDVERAHQVSTEE